MLFHSSKDQKVKGHLISVILNLLFVQKRIGDVVAKFNGEELRRDFPKYVIDAQDFGNVSRFLNHSCDPNVFIQCVLSSHDDFSLPRIAMFAADHIHPLEVHLLAKSHFYSILFSSITLFRPIAMLCGTGSIMRNISHIQSECEEYST